MFSASRSCRDRINLALIAFIWIFFSFSTVAQHQPAKYIVELEKSATPADFHHVFEEMMKTFRTGGIIPFEDEEVMQIVNIARAKPYAATVLPSVYGWAGTMFGNGRMDQAITFFMESAELYGKQNMKLAQALSCFEIALIHHKAENYDEAKAFYEETISLGGDSLNHRIKINCHNGFALIERHKQRYWTAASEFRKAYRLAEINHDTVWMGILAGNIGSIHMRKGDYDSSAYYYFRNLKFIKNTVEFENEIETYSHLGKLFWLMSDFKKSRHYLDSAVAIIEGRKIRFNDFFNPMDYIYETYALLHASEGDYKSAFDYSTRHHRAAEQKQQNINGRSLKQLQSTYAFKQKQKEVELLTKINEANVLVIQHQRYMAVAFAVIALLLGVWGFTVYRQGRQRKKLNNRLSATNEELERLNGVKDKLFSVISHDLRSPIATLKSLMIFLQDGHLKNEDLRPLYTGVRNQLEASDNILESLLQWGKAELSQGRLEIEKVVLANVVNNVALQLKNAMDDKNIQFLNNLSFDLTAMADRAQLEIILRNLIANAVKFTAHGGVIKIAGKVNADSIEIYVEDNGLGMHEEEVKNLFEPGRHFSKIGTNQERGNGLGLLITKEMVRKNGGNIWVNSRKHEGTIFVFTLPLAS
jgi:signal transduction histidine kinase